MEITAAYYQLLESTQNKIRFVYTSHLWYLKKRLLSQSLQYFSWIKTPPPLPLSHDFGFTANKFTPYYSSYILKQYYLAPQL